MTVEIHYFRLLWNLYRQKQNIGRTKEQIEKLQKKKLEKLLLFAYDHSPYYRKAFEEEGIFRDNIKTTPLNRFPRLDKEILMKHFDELVTDRSLKQEELLRFDEACKDDGEMYLGKYHVLHSSGSTGIPRYFIYDQAAWEQMLAGIIRGALWGMTMGSILKLLAEKPRILYIAATDGRYGGAMAVGDGIKGIHAKQRFLDINTPLAKWRETVREFRPNIIIGYPSAVKILAELIGEEKKSLPVKRVISCGEPLSVGLRRFLENTFHTEVINFYGASESLALGVEKRTEEGMVLFDDLNVVEVIDGEMYMTCLYNYAQPLIRYHISDKLVLHEAKNDTDCFFTKADVLLCRSEDVMWFDKPDGSREYLHPLSMEGFCVEGLRDYQFCQTSKTSFEMLAEIGKSAERVKVEQEIYMQIRKLLADKDIEGIRFAIHFVERLVPDQNTGKKSLIIKKMEGKENEKNYDYRKAI